MKVDMKLEDLLQDVPEDIKDIIMDKVKRTIVNGPIEIIKQFVEQYDSDSAVDKLTATVCAEAMGAVYTSLVEWIKGADGDLSGTDAMKIAISQLRETADRIESAHLTLDDDKSTESCKLH